MIICSWCGEKFQHKIDLLDHNAKDTQCHKKLKQINPLAPGADLTPESLEEARKVINSWNLR